jgi:hypothetical protein
MKRYTKEQVEELIAQQPEGRNTRFLNASHSLWFRFKNYEKQPPFVLEDAGVPVALVFITFSARSKYANLYEIVTLEGKECCGYASEVYWEVMKAASEAGMTRLKMSCTSTSVTWHMRNGCIFWAVDPSGSLRVDQPLFPTKAEQLAFREEAIANKVIALPSEPVIEKLRGEGLESHGFGAKKTARVEEAIDAVGDYWFRLSLFEPTHLSLDAFLA